MLLRFTFLIGTTYAELLWPVCQLLCGAPAATCVRRGGGWNSALPARKLAGDSEVPTYCELQAARGLREPMAVSSSLGCFEDDLQRLCKTLLVGRRCMHACSQTCSYFQSSSSLCKALGHSGQGILCEQLLHTSELRCSASQQPQRPDLIRGEDAMNAGGKPRACPRPSKPSRTRTVCLPWFALRASQSLGSVLCTGRWQ